MPPLPKSRPVSRSAVRKRGLPFTAAWRRQVLLGLLAGLLISGLTTAASAFGLLDVLHASALDVLAWWKYLAPSPQIVVVGIDDRSMGRIKAQQSVPREYLATVIRGARRSGARAIGLVADVSTPGPPGADQALVDAINDAHAAGVPVVLSFVASADKQAPGTYARPALAVEGPPAGFVNDPVETDGVVRRFRAALPGAQGVPLRSFALALLTATPQGPAPLTPAGDGSLTASALYWRLRFVTPQPPALAPLRVTPGAWERINYVGPSRTFVTISSEAVAAAAADQAAELPRNPLRDKLVLVGPVFSESGERFRTPTGEMAGVEVQADIVHTLLTRSWVTSQTWGWAVLAQALVCLVGGALFASLHPVEAGLVALIAVAGGFVPVSYLIYGSGDYWIDLAIPLLAVFIVVRAIDRLEQRRLQVSFARYVSPEVVRQVLSTKESRLRAEQREVTILFCDLRDSTALGEKLSMNELMRLLNNYFEMITEAVFRHGGMINKFIGDGILAVYNAPVDVPFHADAAVKTALEIHEQMGQLNKKWGDWLAARLTVSVAIHTGMVISGNVGSALRLEYTIIGDPVNVAARVESLTKDFNARTLITAATRARLAEHYPLKPLGEVPIRGRSEPIELYELS